MQLKRNSSNYLTLNDLRAAGRPKCLIVNDLGDLYNGTKKLPSEEGSKCTLWESIFAIDAFLIRKVDRATYYAFAYEPNDWQTWIAFLLQELA